MNIYRKDFKFATSSYEEIVVGMGRRSGRANIIVKGDVLSDEAIHITFIGVEAEDSLNIAPFCVLPMTEPYMGGDILQDRVMYGRLPQFGDCGRPLVPVVCEIFNNRTTIRFAFLGPLRTIEFHGQFVD